MPVDSANQGSEGPPRKKTIGAMTLKWHLVLLVFGALLPMVVYAAVVVYRLAESERGAADRRLIRSSQELSLALDREIQSAVRTLSALSVSESLDRENLRAFYDEAKRVVSTQPAWLTLILLKPDGQQVVNTNVEWGAQLPAVIEPDSFKRVLVEKRPVVGSLKSGRLRPLLGFSVRVPVMRDGGIRYVITAVITPDALAGLVGLRDDANIEWTRTVVDSQGIIVARSREPERFVGQKVKDSFQQRLSEANEGLFRDAAMDGTPVYIGYSRDPYTGWATAVAVPADLFDSATRSSTAAILGLGLALLLLSTVGAFALSRHISRGLLAATAAAKTMSRGGRPNVETSTVREVTQLGRSLKHSAELLAQRERERNEHLLEAEAARAEAEDARRAQEELLRELGESRGRLQLVADHAPVLITHCGTDRTFKFVNKPYAMRFGLQPSEVVGKHFWEVMGHDAYKAIEHHVDTVLRGERVEFEAEIPYQEIGTRHMWAAYSPEFDEAGKVTGFVSAILDVTERKRTEEALRESEKRFAKAFQASPLALTITSLKDGRLLEVNETFTSLSGYTREEAVGRTTLELGLWARPSEREEELAAVTRQGQVRSTEYTFRMKDGSELVGLLSAEQIEIGGEPCSLTVIQDITEQKRGEAEREHLLESEKALRAKAEEANRLKDEFLATVSHELRTPLTAIMGWAHMLLRGPLDQETARHAVQVIWRNAEQQRQIVEDVLDVSRIVTGKLRLSAERVEVSLVVQSALDTIRPAAEAKGIRLRSRAGAGAAVTGDPARLQQVVWNLLANAVKFTPSGGEVGVSAEQLMTHVRIEVSDTGQGISPEFLPFVFDRFRQADSSTTRQHGGLGLGLAIVRHLVELHGGSVHAYSAGEGQGSTFTVDLPLPVEADLSAPPHDGAREKVALFREAAEDGGETDALPPLVGLRVLLVDDDGDALEMLSVLLRGGGADVTAVSSAAAALAALEQVNPDVLITDIGMPDVDGYELLRKLRSRGTVHGGLTPAIALTAYAAEADRVRALRAGFQVHLAKPVEPEALIAAVVNLAGKTTST